MTTTPATARPIAISVVGASRKFHASPSWISWAITTGPRAQRRVFHSDQAHHASPAAAARKNAVVVTPMVSRVERRLASSRTASTTSTNASSATRAAATWSGGGAIGSGPGGSAFGVTGTAQQ